MAPFRSAYTRGRYRAPAAVAIGSNSAIRNMDGASLRDALAKPLPRLCSEEPQFATASTAQVTLAMIVHRYRLSCSSTTAAIADQPDIQLAYGSSPNLDYDRRIAAWHPGHHESRGVGSIRSNAAAFM